MKVEITYRSGKVEIADIALRDYLAALKSLTSEGRLVGIRILPTRMEWVDVKNK